MRQIRFEWDRKKDRISLAKHGVSFQEASSVFYGDNAIEFFDPGHSENEDRFLMLGISYRSRMLIVSHCYRKRYEVIRIISARKSDREEQQCYYDRR